jgi:hypothetical protein
MIGFREYLVAMVTVCNYSLSYFLIRNQDLCPYSIIKFKSKKIKLQGQTNTLFPNKKEIKTNLENIERDYL